MSSIGIVELIFFVFLIVGLLGFIWWLIMLIEALKVPDQAWAAAGQNKLVFVLLMALLGVIGTIVYAVVARPALRAAGARF